MTLLRGRIYLLYISPTSDSLGFCGGQLAYVRNSGVFRVYHPALIGAELHKGM